MPRAAIELATGVHLGQVASRDDHDSASGHRTKINRRPEPPRSKCLLLQVFKAPGLVKMITGTAVSMFLHCP
jgi:hypothetical protein